MDTAWCSSSSSWAGPCTETRQYPNAPSSSWFDRWTSGRRSTTGARGALWSTVCKWSRPSAERDGVSFKMKHLHLLAEEPHCIINLSTFIIGFFWCRDSLWLLQERRRPQRDVLCHQHRVWDASAPAFCRCFPRCQNATEQQTQHGGPTGEERCTFVQISSIKL